MPQDRAERTQHATLLQLQALHLRLQRLELEKRSTKVINHAAKRVMANASQAAQRATTLLAMPHDRKLHRSLDSRQKGGGSTLVLDEVCHLLKLVQSEADAGCVARSNLSSAVSPP